MPDARNRRINRLIERALAVSLSSQGRTLANRIKKYETQNSRAHKMPDWDGLKEAAWKNYR